VIDVAIVTDSPHLKQVKHLVDYLTALGEKSRTIRRVLVPHLSVDLELKGGENSAIPRLVH
jgi:hypothetical protein